MIPKLRLSATLTMLLNVYPRYWRIINVNKYTNGNVIAIAIDHLIPRNIVAIIIMRTEVSLNPSTKELNV